MPQDDRSKSRGLWVSDWRVQLQYLMGNRIAGVGTYRPEDGRSRSVWASGQQDQGFVDLRIICRPQDGIRWTLWCSYLQGQAKEWHKQELVGPQDGGRKRSFASRWPDYKIIGIRIICVGTCRPGVNRSRSLQPSRWQEQEFVVISMVQEGGFVCLIVRSSNSWVSGWYTLKLIVFRMARTGLKGPGIGGNLNSKKKNIYEPQDSKIRMLWSSGRQEQSLVVPSISEAGSGCNIQDSEADMEKGTEWNNKQTQGWQYNQDQIIVQKVNQ